MSTIQIADVSDLPAIYDVIRSDIIASLVDTRYRCSGVFIKTVGGAALNVYSLDGDLFVQLDLRPEIGVICMSNYRSQRQETQTISLADASYLQQLKAYLESLKRAPLEAYLESLKLAPASS